jgi:hypothetical protein
MNENSINKHKSFTMPGDIIVKIEDYKEASDIDESSVYMYELIIIGYYDLKLIACII